MPGSDLSFGVKIFQKTAEGIFLNRGKINCHALRAGKVAHDANPELRRQIGRIGDGLFQNNSLFFLKEAGKTTRAITSMTHKLKNEHDSTSGWKRLKVKRKLVWRNQQEKGYYVRWLKEHKKGKERSLFNTLGVKRRT